MAVESGPVTYWFLSLLWRRPGANVWHPVNATTQGEHPIAYVKRAREVHPNNDYVLMFFTEIPEELFIFAQS